MQMNKIQEGVWEIPKTEKDGMRVPARIFASEKLIEIMDKGVFDQITNVACLPGIQKNALCMPDGHWGYGFPIGGVAAFSTKDGMISPGGIGFDINCGVRLIRTDLTLEEVKPKMETLMDTLFKLVPAGVGSRGIVKLNSSTFKEVMIKGVDWCIENGYGWQEDRDRIEEGGHMKGANPSKVSQKAISRGIDQLGTLGSGNHYLEIQVGLADQIYDPEIAKVYDVSKPDQIFVMVHCGSRGFGHQIATDYLQIFLNAMKKYGIRILDKELACAPFNSSEGQDYFSAMVCAANSAFANRQVITHRIREGFSEVFNKDARDLGMHIVYDVAHNIAKIEKHNLDGEEKEVIVHRKGATRSFPPNHLAVTDVYREVGQPVIVGGSMETGSYLLAGTQKAYDMTFGSTCHGAGRVMSRMAAKRKVRGTELRQRMTERGMVVRAVSMSGLAEEAGLAYKNIDEVVKAVDSIGISKKVLQLRPLGSIKG
ncbi:MAG: tRNA-splicing ligase [candidate division Zixibacteria bacterium SM1_73]|nr:MAG: tRNA-splicing ligase [candidate division Zixibacteria bacterium SM1_73]